MGVVLAPAREFTGGLDVDNHIPVRRPVGMLKFEAEWSLRFHRQPTV